MEQASETQTSDAQQKLSKLESLPAEVLSRIYEFSQNPNFVYTSAWLHGITSFRSVQSLLISDVLRDIGPTFWQAERYAMGILDYPPSETALAKFFHVVKDSERWLTNGHLVMAGIAWLRFAVNQHLASNFKKYDHFFTTGTPYSPPDDYKEQKAQILAEASALMDRIEHELVPHGWPEENAKDTEGKDYLIYHSFCGRARAMNTQSWTRYISFEIFWPPAIIVNTQFEGGTVALPGGRVVYPTQWDFLCPEARALLPDPAAWTRSPEKLVAEQRPEGPEQTNWPWRRPESTRETQAGPWRRRRG